MHMKMPLPAVQLKLVTHSRKQSLDSVAKCCRIEGDLPGRDIIKPCLHNYTHQVEMSECNICTQEVGNLF